MDPQQWHPGRPQRDLIGEYLAEVIEGPPACATAETDVEFVRGFTSMLSYALSAAFEGQLYIDPAWLELLGTDAAR